MAKATANIALDMEAWAVANTTGLSSYPSQPESIEKALPLVIADVRRDVVESPSGPFSKLSYEQIDMRVTTVALILMVSPSPVWTADQALYAIADDLAHALRLDRTLGQRVEEASRYYTVDYQGEAQHEDGTVVRIATFQVTVGEKVDL